jgi:hypothetical protein
MFILSYDWLHFGYSHKRRRRAGYPECPDTEKTKRLEAAWNRIKFWQKHQKFMNARMTIRFCKSTGTSDT